MRSTSSTRSRRWNGLESTLAWGMALPAFRVTAAKPVMPYHAQPAEPVGFGQKLHHETRSFRVRAGTLQRPREILPHRVVIFGQQDADHRPFHSLFCWA